MISHTLPPLDTRSRPPAEFMDNLLEVMTKIFPDQVMKFVPSNAFKIQVGEREIYVEVITFEPMQEILVSWNLKVSLLCCQTKGDSWGVWCLGGSDTKIKIFCLFSLLVDITE